MSDAGGAPGERPYVAVIGSSEAHAELAAAAEAVGLRLAEQGAVLVCGGLGGVMEAACRGALSAGGMTVGVLGDADRRRANPFVEVALATGIGEARNAIVAGAADAVIAVGGEYGTLSEIALAMRAGKPVIGLDTWELARAGRPDERIVRAASPEQAVEMALRLRGSPGR